MPGFRQQGTTKLCFQYTIPSGENQLGALDRSSLLLFLLSTPKRWLRVLNIRRYTRGLRRQRHLLSLFSIVEAGDAVRVTI